MNSLTPAFRHSHRFQVVRALYSWDQPLNSRLTNVSVPWQETVSLYSWNSVPNTTSLSNKRKPQTRDLSWINNTSYNGWLQGSFYRKVYAPTLLCAIDTMGLGAMHMEREYLKLLDGTILRAQLHTCHTWHGLRNISYSMIQKHRGDYAASYPTIPSSLNALFSSGYILLLEKSFMQISCIEKTFVMSLRITLCSSG